MSHLSKMTKKSKVISEEDQLQIDMQLEADLSRFQRQHRNLERDCSNTGGSKMGRQRRLIGILEKEQYNILTDLNVAACSTKKKEDAHINSEMMTLVHENDHFEGKIKETKIHLQEIDDMTVLVKKEIVTMCTKITTDDKHQERVLAGQKVVAGLENKLDTAVKCFCSIQAENGKLRTEIEHFFIERVNFNKQWNKLISNLNKGKKFMIDIIEQATIAYNEREEWCTKLQAVRSRAQHDLIMDSQEMLQLQRQKDDYGKLEQFLSVKGQKRKMQDLLRRRNEKKLQRRKDMEKYLIQCEEILANIMDFTECTELQDIYLNCVCQAEKNFSMFNYINSLHQEIEELNDTLISSHINIDSQTILNSQRAQHQSDNLEKLRNELLVATQVADEAEAKRNATNDTLQKLYKGIDKLFKICNCSNLPLMQLLGDNTTVNDYNALLHLNMMEERISELILKVYYAQKISKKDKTRRLLIDEDRVSHRVLEIEKIVPTNPCPLCVEQEQVSDVIDTLQFVLTKQEVSDKLQLRLTLPDGFERLHAVSACNLPKSREIIQRRYQ